MAQEENLNNLISSSQDVVIIQADNPDGDSLASALALEDILSNLGKNVSLYCGSDMPKYLKYMTGWDRVRNELPAKFDLSIIVDTTAITLLEQLSKTGEINWLKTKPCIVLDHHISATPSIDFATEIYLKPGVSTGEIIYELSQKLNWPLSLEAKNYILLSIMSDSLGLTTDGTTARSIEIISELVKDGVSIPNLEEKRRSMSKKSPEILKYKAKLLDRIEYSDNGTIAIVHIPWEEIEKYSHEYNPSILAMDEMRMVEGVAIAVAFKTYPDGKITAKLRANYGYGIADVLAANFGGGGHPYAAGFKITNGKPYNQIKSECIIQANKLLQEIRLEQGKQDEATQHTYTIS